MVQQLSRQAQYTIAPEVMILASNKDIASKVLTWDANLWGTGLGYSPNEIERVEFQRDIFRFKLTGDRARNISAEQFIRYWNSIKAYEAEMTIQDLENLENEDEDEEQTEIEQMRAAELEAHPQPQQPRLNPNTAWYRELERVATAKGYRVAPYDGLIRKAIIYGRTTKAYIQFTLAADKWAVAFTFNGQPQMFETLGEAIAHIEASDTPQVLIEPWVFDKPVMSA